MKTIPLEEAMKLAASIPILAASSGTITTQDREPITMTINGRPLGPYTTVLLAHFYSHGPELVELLREIVHPSNHQIIVGLRHGKANALRILEKADALLAKASTVQMP